MPSQSARRNDSVMLAGWVFADLLLGLMVIFLVSAPGAAPLPPPTPDAAAAERGTALARAETVTATARAAVAASTTARAGAAATATIIAARPTATPTDPALAVLETESVDFTFRLGDTNAELDTQLTEQLQPYRAAGRRAGFVMVFSAESARSQVVIDRLTALLPEVFARGAVLRPYIDLGLRNSETGRRTVSVEIFFFRE